MSIVQIVIVSLLAVEGILYGLAIILALLHRSGQGETVGLFCLYAFFSFLLILPEALRQVGVLTGLGLISTHAIQLFGVLVLALVMLFLVRSFLHLQKGKIWAGIGVAWLVMLAVFVSNLLPIPEVLWKNGQIEVSRDWLSFAIALSGWVILMIGAFLAARSTVLRTPQPLRRNRINYLVPFFVLLAANDSLFFFGLRDPSGILRLLAVLLFAYILIQFKLPDARLMLRQASVYLSAAILLVLLYLAGAHLAQYLIRTEPQYDPLLVGGILTLVLAAFFVPLLGLARRMIYRVLPFKQYNPSQMLREYSLAISNILDLQRLATVSVGVIIEMMDIRRAFLFLVDGETGEDGQVSFALRGTGEKPVQGVTMSGSSPIGKCFSIEHALLLQYDLDMLPRYQEAAASEREWLAGLGVEVYVPLFAKDKWVGLLALGARSSGSRYSEDDLSLLAAIANQTAIALENARLVENLVELNREIRQAYQALGQASRNLEKLDQTKTNFISIASHELRTPLTLMRGYTEMLLEDPSVKQNRYHLQTIEGIHKGILRLHEIMDSMFDIVQIDTRTLDLHMVDVNVSELVKSVCEELKNYSAERKQTLNMDLPLLPSIKADPNTLRKVFFHLLTNAIKFTPDGGRIMVGGRYLPPNRRDLPEGGVEVIVADTGVGVDPNYRELIFAKFYQVEEDLNKHSTGKSKFKGGGAGLGLTLSKGIVEAHGGRIWVESPGYDEVNFPGSQFHVVLPLRHQSDSNTIRMGEAIKIKL